jgi:hypothetical protein
MVKVNKNAKITDNSFNAHAAFIHWLHSSQDPTFSEPGGSSERIHPSR